MRETYRLRGNRVQPLDVESIDIIASNIARIFKITKRNRRKLDATFEKLFEFGITLNVISDEEWLFVTRGHYDPDTMTISLPQSVYYHACGGQRDALEIVLHEMGHLFLGHKAILHHSSREPTCEEDAEWQADMFAEIILRNMGYQMEQISFDFYM